jgi:hypothetical protein
MVLEGGDTRLRNVARRLTNRPSLAEEGATHLETGERDVRLINIARSIRGEESLSEEAGSPLRNTAQNVGLSGGWAGSGLLAPTAEEREERAEQTQDLIREHVSDPAAKVREATSPAAINRWWNENTPDIPSDPTDPGSWSLKTKAIVAGIVLFVLAVVGRPYAALASEIAG